MNDLVIWGWGRLSSSFSSANPVQLSCPEKAIGLFIGRKGSLVWTSDELYSWGEDLITSNEHISPFKLPNTASRPVQALCQNSVTVILSDEGLVYKYESFTETGLYFSEKIKSIACGSEHILALDINGKVYSWGNSTKGQLGQGPSSVVPCTTPRLILTEHRFVDVVCGYNHSMALDELGKLFTWGAGADGRLGHENSNDVYEPTQVLALTQKFIVHISCGYLHSAVISNTGELITFGFNGYGQLGLGNVETKYLPTVVPSLLGRRVLNAACGAFHTICICENGDIFSMGMGNKGQLGTGSNLNSVTPEKSQLYISDSSQEYAKLYCGSENSFLMTSGRCELGQPSRPTISESQDISMTSDSTSAGYRPSNLPPKDPAEAAQHKRLVAEQARMYLDRIREKEKINQRYQEKKIMRENEIQEMMKTWEAEILPNWDKKRKSKQVERLVKKGLPPKVRGEVWLRFIGNPMGITQDFFMINVTKAQKLRLQLEAGNLEAVGKEGSLKFINTDISRTFHQMGYFREGSPLNFQLRDMLEAFTISRPDIGYVQGMSYVAGILLLNLEPYKAFVVLVNIISSPLLIPFYRLDQVGITRRCQMFRLLLRHNLPELTDHFETEGVKPGMFLIEWFLTLFARTLNQDLTSRIWDLYVMNGPVVLFQTGIALLKIVAPSLANEDLAGIMTVIGSIGSYVVDGDFLVNCIESISIPQWIEQEMAYMAEENL